MFNFLAFCSHLPNFAGIVGNKESDGELHSYTNFGMPEGVTTDQSGGTGFDTTPADTNCDCGSFTAHNDSDCVESTTDCGNANSLWGPEVGEVPHSTMEDPSSGDNQPEPCAFSSQDLDDDNNDHWFYIPAGPFCKPLANPVKAPTEVDDNSLCLTIPGDLHAPTVTNPSVRGLLKVLDRGWISDSAQHA